MKGFAIVGDGEVTKLHAKNIERIGRLIALCGADDSETKTLATEYNANIYSSLDELLSEEKEVDIIVVCSPTGLHAEHIIKSLQAGKDVVCEAPLCLTKAAAWQIIETEKYCQRRLYLIQPSRFYASINQLRDDLKEGNVKVRSFHLNCSLFLPADFRSSADSKQFPGGGLLYKPFGSLIDILVFLFGEIVSVNGFVSYPFDKTMEDVEDTGAVSLKMQDGVIGTLHWSSVIAGQPTLTILAENSFMQAHLDDPGLLKLQSGWRLSDDFAEDISNGFYKTVYEDLYKALRGKDVSFTGSLDGAKTVEAIEKIYKAVR